MKPPFAYYGGKAGMAQTIAALLPPHKTYIEPFFGSGAVLFAKEPAPIEIVNDLDDRVVAFFRCLRERPDELERVCRLTPHARTEYLDARDQLADETGELERARLFWVVVNQSFTASTSTGWSITTGRNQSVPGTILSRISRFHECAGRLASVSIENVDAVDLIRRLARSDAVVYIDPPYLASARQTSGDDYRIEMGSEDRHRDLADALRSTEAAVVLSGYPSDLYDELYPGWPYLDFEVGPHSSKARKSTTTGRIERLWSNRPLSLEKAQGEMFGSAR